MEQVATVADARPVTPRDQAPPDGLRADIQGLRAVAVLVVLLFHFWPKRLTGGYVGVDVFFVISGFLISSHLLRTPPTSARLLAAFWARRVRRLLPAASLVLLVSFVASLLWMPSTLLASIARETAASAVSLENWVLANAATDYLAADNDPSPLQHYWSLSVEEQFYVAWPVLIAILWFVGRRRPMAWVGAGLVAVTAASLAASVLLTRADPAAAYFVTHTRVWELGLGSLLAFAVHQGWRVDARWARVLLAWAGLAMIAWASWRYSGSTPFPGTAALLPTVGAAAVIAAAADGVRGGPGPLLGSRPARLLGDLSYSVYLWHWPVVVIAPVALGRDLTWVEKLAAVAGVLVLAWLTKQLVEDPVRRARSLTRSTPRSLGLALVSVAVLAGGSFVVIHQAETAQAQEEQAVAREIADAGDCVGAAATREAGCASIAGDELITSPAVAAADRSDLYEDGCWSNRPYTKKKVCTYGRQGGDTRVALIGNSHAGHWQPALAPIAQERGWQLDTYLVSQCYTVDIPLDFGSAALTENCRSWNAWATGRIIRGKYDLVVMSNRTFQQVVGVSSSAKYDVTKQAYAATMKRFTDAGIPVLVLRDTPGSRKPVPDCVAANLHDVEACSLPLKRSLEGDPLDAAAQDDTTGLVSRLDLTERICPDGRCHFVIGGLITYFDHGHLTKTFARTLIPDLAPALEKAVAAGS